MGFDRFVLIDTIRFGARPSFAYRMPSGELRHLEPATYTSRDFEARLARPEQRATKGAGGGRPFQTQWHCRNALSPADGRGHPDSVVLRLGP